MEYSKELIEKASECKSKEELEKLAKENHIVLSNEEADKLFVTLNKKGELSDEELNSVSGGLCSDYELPDPKYKIGDKVLVRLYLDMFGDNSKVVLVEVTDCEVRRSSYVYTVKVLDNGETMSLYEDEMGI